MTEINNEYKYELARLARNLKGQVEKPSEDANDFRIVSFVETKIVPKFLKDLINNNLESVQALCDFDIKELVKKANLKSPEFDLTSDIKSDNGKVYQSFKTGNSYTSDFFETEFNQGDISGQHAKLLITNDMPILKQQLDKYLNALDVCYQEAFSVLDLYCKNNNLYSQGMTIHDSKFPNGHKCKNESIKVFIEQEIQPEFMDKFGFDKVCKDIEKSLKEHFTVDNKKTNKNTL